MPRRCTSQPPAAAPATVPTKPKPVLTMPISSRESPASTQNGRTIGPSARSGSRNRSTKPSTGSTPLAHRPAPERAAEIAPRRGRDLDARRGEREAGERERRDGERLVRAVPADPARKQQHAAAEDEDRDAVGRDAHAVRRAFLAGADQPDRCRRRWRCPASPRRGRRGRSPRRRRATRASGRARRSRAARARSRRARPRSSAGARRSDPRAATRAPSPTTRRRARRPHRSAASDTPRSRR